jgi:hypothetical protein
LLGGSIVVPEHSFTSRRAARTKRSLDLFTSCHRHVPAEGVRLGERRGVRLMPVK